MKPTRLLAIIAALFLTGCESLKIGYEGMKSPSSERLKSYQIMRAPEIEGNRLLADQVTARVKAALAKRGYYESANPDLLIKLYYEQIPPQTFQRHHTTPIYGQTGGGSSYFNATSFTSQGPVTTSGQVTQSPTYGVLGYSSGTTLSTWHPVVFSLYAVDYKTYQRTRQLVPAWSLHARAFPKNSDVRSTLTQIIDKITPHIGTDTGRDRKNY